MDVPTGQRWTYARLDADTDALARGLIAACLTRPGAAEPGVIARARITHATPAG